jgi:hypothetical protein
MSKILYTKKKIFFFMTMNDVASFVLMSRPLEKSKINGIVN